MGTRMESYSLVLPVPVPTLFFIQNNLINFIFHSTALETHIQLCLLSTFWKHYFPEMETE